MKHSFIFSCIILLLAGCRSKEKVVPTAVLPVVTAVAIARDVPIFLEALGHVDSMDSIQIRSRIEGELTGVYFRQGQEVKKGDLLFTIDPKPYQAELQRAQGKLSQDRANLSLSEEKVKRYKMLAQGEYYSQMDYETLQANLAANVGAAQQSQADVDSAAIRLDYCWIYAPVDGKMGILQIDLGNLVSADGSKPLATLNQMTPIFVTFSVPEIQLPRIQMAMKNNQDPLKVLCAYENFSQETFEGCLYMLDNVVNPETGMIKLRASFENKNRELWPGQFIRTRLHLSTQKDAILIPQEAVQRTVRGPIVYIVNEDSTVEPRQVALGQRQDDQILVLEGVREGERVVTEGQLNLSQGAKVKEIGS